MPKPVEEEQEEEAPVMGWLTVIENAFHFKQLLPLYLGDNVVGRQVKGTKATTPIKTVDPSVDTTHCILNVREKKNGEVVFTVRDAPSNTGTFVHNTLVGLKEQVRLEPGDIITIGATSMIFHTGLDEEE
jgi:hypothetical protein